MAPETLRARSALLLVALLFAARFDLWNQNSAATWFGLPVALAYHVVFCFAAVAALALLVRWAWPDLSLPEAGPDLHDRADLR